MCKAQPVWKACLQCGHKNGDNTPVPLGSMAVKQIGQATSSAVAVGGWLLAWRRCGGVDGAGWGAVVGAVVCMLSAGVVRSMGSSEARDITHTEHKVQKTRDGGVQRISKKSTGGFQFCGGLPVPTFFLFCTFCYEALVPFFFEAPVKLELFLYWPVSRCAYGATVFWVVAGSTRSKVHLQRSLIRFMLLCCVA
jgi:hypothetical protein